MGCGGSKQKQQGQQDVAAGNAVARRVLLRSSTVARGRKAFALSADPDASRLSEAAVAGEAKPASSGSSEEEYFSSSREMESPEAGEYLSPGADANADVEESVKVAAAAAAAVAAAAAAADAEEEEREDKAADGIYWRNKC